MPRSAALEVLRQKYAWPSERPAEQPISWVMDGGGRQRLIKIIQERRVEVMIEIGVFMGGSLRTWLNASPTLQIVAIDPWPPLPKGWSRHPHVVPLLRGKP